MITNYPNGLSSFGGLLFGGLGIGNVYYVVKTADTAVYQDMLRRYGDERYADGSKILYLATAATADVAIQQALDACVECRNDYVVVMPSNSDYDITAAITLSKKSVHLICPAGMGNERGATNAARIEQTTAATAIFTVSDAAIEIAGFYLKPYIGCTHITLTASSCYAPNIHHNTLVLQWTTSNLPAIVGTGDAGAWGSIEKNWFISQGGDDQTCASIISIAAPATGARVNYNDFMIGDGNTATVGILNLATKGSCNYNTFAGAANDGAFTHCIQIGAAGSAIGNRSSISADGEIVIGGVQHKSYSDNMNSVNGGVVDDEQ